jgi:hypothetical protein
VGPYPDEWGATMQGGKPQSPRMGGMARFRGVALRVLVAAGLIVLFIVDGSAGSVASTEGAPLELRLSNTPFESEVGAEGPNALVHVPIGFDSQRGYRVVLFLHDEDVCIAALAVDGAVECEGGDVVSGWDLAGRHESLGDPQSVLIAPSMSDDQSSSGAGRLAEPGFAGAMIDEVLLTLRERGLFVSPDELEEVTVVASGTGFEGALAVLADEELPVRDVVFLEALYGGSRELLEWLGRDERHRVLSVSTPEGIARMASRLLLYRAIVRLPSAQARSFALGDDPGDARVLVVEAKAMDENGVADAYFDDALRALAR